jgi:pyridinium-3,5-biscarboxylic acid mononucleotide synthase
MDMQRQDLERFARRLASGEMTVDSFLAQAALAFSEGGEAIVNSQVTLDIDRERRCGFPEAVFGEGQTVETLKQIIQTLASRNQDVLVTRVSQNVAAELIGDFPTARYNKLARTFRMQSRKSPVQHSEIQPPHVAVITAGTTDLPVADEARETLDWMGVRVTMIQDVGVAGPHRLPARLAEFEKADAIVVVAGMEGALPSIVGGYVACPVIAVPTSVGYGANFAGVSALLSMLNSCASNVAVVNIDAGFKGGYLAGLIATRSHAAKKEKSIAPAPT